MFSLLRRTAIKHFYSPISSKSILPQARLNRYQSISNPVAMSTKYIEPDELAAIMKSDKVPKKDYFIIDVRDDDYVGGNIKGSHNSPSYRFLSKVDELVEQTKNVPVIVFHCALSQVRGPKAARIYSQTRAIQRNQNENVEHEVFILRGGFSDFQAKFKDDPDLVENWDKEVWASEWAA
ncbi:Rhodanese-like domain-containing protein [Abortiporus biennis]|nr:Rhodanese-like domain-containing protein [Abortiporus biennis]